MYFKVVKDGNVVDALDRLIYAKWQEKHQMMTCCEEKDAQAILSSDGNYVWHVAGLYNIPTNGYDTVELHKCDEYEYKQLKNLGLKTPQDIIDAYTLELIDGGTL